jgi:hypothetical protein
MFGPCSIAPVGGWGSQKPPSGVPVDRGHPLAAGLRNFTLFNEGRGVGAFDPVAGLLYVWAGLPNHWTPDYSGGAGRFGVSTDDYMTVASDGFGAFNYQTFTLYFDVYIPSIADYVILFSYDCTSHVYPYYAAHLRIVTASSGSAYFGYNDGAGLRSNSFSTVTAGNHRFALTFTSGAQRMWMDGKELSGAGNVAGAITYYHQPVWIGRANFKLGGDIFSQPFTLRTFGYWNRVLRPDEVCLLHAQPYCMFETGMPPARAMPARPLVDGSLVSDTPLLGAIA